MGKTTADQRRFFLEASARKKKHMWEQNWKLKEEEWKEEL